MTLPHSVEQGRQSAPCADQLDVGEPFRLVLFVVGLTLGRAELYRVALGLERLRRGRIGVGCRFLQIYSIEKCILISIKF